ncbi:putative ferredoxin [Alloactinosynnema sp. L-07]|uniref:ferredoxin n=1 Tax=Alloactinosynnema sp. L-07 TaxID=1653480 RepID=UPI00065EFB2B|nr:ferredoxin [Alloactinosynnema sp. L-07]CRK59562.1 putative ferredoxin [Alloactinosynnema sp. L-07]
MKIEVDRDQCEANGVCVGVAPEVFELDDDDELHISEPDGDIDPRRVAQAVASCPKVALTLRA